MSNLQSSADKAQMIELLNSIKMPIMGAGGGFAPIGTINFFDATVAPQGWLACDGTTYNITDYPELATFYASVHGASNFYGGNGTTTFAVPDLRGEFLRGSGTNSHANQGNGANVGVHQDGTGHIQFKRDTNFTMYGGDTEEKTFTNQDSQYGDVTGRRYLSLQQYGSDAWKQYFTSRPTNTSFLICVKATLSDAEINNMHVYSPNEHQVGWWQEEVDGVLKQKPVYEVTKWFNESYSTGQSYLLHGISNVDMIVEFDFGWYNSDKTATVPIPNTWDSNNCLYVACDRTRFTLNFAGNWSSNAVYQKARVRYTKTTDQWETV